MIRLFYAKIRYWPDGEEETRESAKLLLRGFDSRSGLSLRSSSPRLSIMHFMELHTLHGDTRSGLINVRYLPKNLTF